MSVVRSALQFATDMSQSRFLALSALLALVPRLALVLLLQPQPSSDFAWYSARAMAIAEDRGYVLDDGTPTAFWPVGYPALLGGVFHVFGPTVFAGELANVAVSVATIVVFFLVAVRLTDSIIIPRLATLAVVFWPNQIAYCALLSDTLLFQFLLYASLLVLMTVPRRLMLVPAGLLIGLTTLVRPYGIMIPLVFVVARMSRERLWRLVHVLVIAYAAAAVVLAPWTVRNYSVFGAFVFVSTNGGETLLTGNNPRANGTYVDGENGSSALLSDNFGEYARDQEAKKLALTYIVQNPVRTLAMAGPKLFYTFAEDADGLRWILKETRGTAAGLVTENGRAEYAAGLTRYLPLDYVGMILFQVYYMVAMLGFGGYFLLKARRSEVQSIDTLALGIVGWVASVSVVFLGQPRFHIPAMPAIGLYAAAFAVSPAVRSMWRGAWIARPTDHVSAPLKYQ
jgi:hypothetical protein